MAYDEKSKERTLRYLAKQRQVRFWVTPEQYETFQAVAEVTGYDSLRQFCLDAIREKINRSVVYAYGMNADIGFSPERRPHDGYYDYKIDKTGKYHEILLYERILTEEELQNCSLDYLGIQAKEV